MKFIDLTQTFCAEFAEYLQSTKSNKSNKVGLSQNTTVSYFNKLKAALKQAYKDGYLQEDLNSKVAHLKQADTFRNFLTLEELNILAGTECQNPVLKKWLYFLP